MAPGSSREFKPLWCSPRGHKFLGLGDVSAVEIRKRMLVAVLS